MNFLHFIFLFCNLSVLTDTSDASSLDYYCNKHQLTWKDAMNQCHHAGGLTVPYETGEGNYVADLKLKPGITVWTSDYTMGTTQHEINPNDPNNYDCGYATVRKTRNKYDFINNTFGLCNQERLFVCKSCNYNRPCTFYTGMATWTEANRNCTSFWKGHENIEPFRALPPQGMYSLWINEVRHISYGSIKEPSYIPGILRSCGFHSSGTGLNYTLCEEKFMSVCKFGGSVRPGNVNFSRTCFSRHNTQHITRPTEPSPTSKKATPVKITAIQTTQSSTTVTQSTVSTTVPPSTVFTALFKPKYTSTFQTSPQKPKSTSVYFSLATRSSQKSTFIHISIPTTNANRTHLKSDLSTYSTKYTSRTGTSAASTRTTSIKTNAPSTTPLSSTKHHNTVSMKHDINDLHTRNSQTKPTAHSLIQVIGEISTNESTIVAAFAGLHGQENTESEKGYAVKIGLPLTGIAMLIIVIGALLFLRRHIKLRRTPENEHIVIYQDSASFPSNISGDSHQIVGHSNLAYESADINTQYVSQNDANTEAEYSYASMRGGDMRNNNDAESEQQLSIYDNNVTPFCDDKDYRCTKEDNNDNAYQVINYQTECDDYADNDADKYAAVNKVEKSGDGEFIYDNAACLDEDKYTENYDTTLTRKGCPEEHKSENVYDKACPSSSTDDHDDYDSTLTFQNKDIAPRTDNTYGTANKEHEDYDTTLKLPKDSPAMSGSVYYTMNNASKQ